MKKKILFIDDDPTILLISEIMLEALGYDVITADGFGTYIASASLLSSGRFYSVTAKLNPVIICLDDAGTGGTEYTFFGKDVTNPITFATTSISHSIISENGYLSMYGTGSAVTAKQIGSGPVIWALIGSLKA